MQQTTLKQNRKNYGYSTKMKVDLFNKAENIEEKGEIDHYKQYRKKTYSIKLKTLRQKEKLIIISNTSFCQNVFNHWLMQGLLYVGMG